MIFSAGLSPSAESVSRGTIFYVMTTTPNAKINLGLRVCGLRPDGYHDIETVFLPYFGLCDSLEIVAGDDFSRTLAGLISKYGGIEGSCGDKEGLADGCCAKIRQGISADGKCMITIAREEGVDWKPLEDLCVKAYMALDADFSLPPVKIILEKLIPVGAGLGGGSSDGAFTLRMLSEMFALGLDSRRLLAYASRLGSDCAFFVENRPMFGEGRGEILSPLEIPQLESYEIQVVVPSNIRVNTAKAYKEIDNAPVSVTPTPATSCSDVKPAATAQQTPAPNVSDTVSPPARFLRSAILSPIGEWKNLIVNDFEKPVFAQYPQLAAVKLSLYDSGAVYASMSGTGSALYGIYPK